MKRILCLLFCALLAAAGSLGAAEDDPVSSVPDIGDPATPGLGNTGYDVQHYDLQFDIDMAAQRFENTTTLTLASTLDGLQRLSLDYAGPPVTEVRVDGAPVEAEMDGYKLWVTLPKPADAGDIFEITVLYTGLPGRFQSPYMPFLELGVYANQENEHLFAFNEPDGARAWFPCNDHPLDKATFAFTLTVPGHLTAIANGTPGPPAENPDGTLTYTWNMDAPMATYLAVIAVGDYEVLEMEAPNGIPLRHYYFAGQSEDDVKQRFGFTGEVMAYFEHIFGPYPFESYGHVLTPQNAVGMETQTMTIMPMQAPPIMVVHELAHQWFGDYISPASWHDIWLNEGFATYAEVLWVEYIGSGQDVAAYLSRMEAEVLGMGKFESLAMPDIQNLFGKNSYEKGGWVLHMLRQEVGNAAFLEILRTYLERFGGGTASTKDFWQIAEEISGQELDPFFEQWLYRPGNPMVNLFWTPQGEVLVCQVVSPESEPFVFDLPLGFTGEDGATEDLLLLEVDEMSERASFALDFTASRLWADPVEDVLAFVTGKEVQTLPAGCP